MNLAVQFLAKLNIHHVNHLNSKFSPVLVGLWSQAWVARMTAPVRSRIALFSILCFVELLFSGDPNRFLPLV